jgi:hypothetical protein
MRAAEHIVNYIILGSWWQAKGTALSSPGFAASLALVKERSLFIASADFEWMAASLKTGPRSACSSKHAHVIVRTDAGSACRHK